MTHADPALAAQLQACLTAYDMDRTPDPATERAAVKATLDLLTAKAPGKAVEVRVPPYAAVQAVEGVRHRRGTPAAVVEADPETWLRLATGALAWGEAVASGKLRASGERSDLSGYLPLA
ncbi:MAG: sterol carrier family protein [bacterium]